MDLMDDKNDLLAAEERKLAKGEKKKALDNGKGFVAKRGRHDNCCRGFRFDRRRTTELAYSLSLETSILRYHKVLISIVVQIYHIPTSH